MAARPADNSTPRPRPRPAPAASTPAAEPAEASESSRTTPPRSRTARGTRRTPGRAVARQQQAQSQQVAVAAGNAVVTAARVGRLLGRTGWRLAKQLPGVNAVEAQAQRLGQAMTSEFARLLEMPQGVFSGGTPEEQRAMMLIQNAATDTEPLRSAMTELLDRSAETDGTKSRDYLFGTIVSQLVPDEARILAALSGGKEFAAVDVVGKAVGRSAGRVELANASTVGLAAGVSLLQSTGTYLTRLHNFGLVEFGAPNDELDSQFDALHEDPTVQRARANAEHGKGRTVRKSVSLTPFGRDFWAACAPTPGQVSRRQR